MNQPNATAAPYKADMKTRVGIDALAVAVPRRYVDLEDVARARGVDPAKFTVGLGAREMAVAEPGEDTVALAAQAAERVLARVDRDSLGMLVVGTETGVDHSKAVASYVHGLLELPRAMRVFDTQHACYGGTAGLMAAAEWIASGAGAGRSALVICSDIARYGVKTAGEPTQGAGAIAMIVREDPALLALDVGASGTASAHVHDFWRPLGQREAQVDGHYSVQCYLEALSTAYAGWKRHDLQPLARICYHVPFCKMARKAHAQLRAVDGLADDERSFAEQVAPSLVACSRVGNIYTGSLYLALAGLLDAQAGELASRRIGMFSYGSGCTSEFFSGTVTPRAAERIAQTNLAGVLAERERIDVAEYERILALTEPLPGARRFHFTGVENHRRQYSLQ
jgi:hydroxymethylglutaryl-CoA synthase